MAPLTARSSSPLKRTLSQSGELDAPRQASKRLRRPYVHHHSFQPYQEEILDQSTSFDQDTVDQLLTRSIGLVLGHDGFEIAKEPSFEAFGAAVEEFMLHFCACIRQSMTACRRTQPIPQDFEYALSLNDMSLSSLEPHLKPPIPSLISQPKIPTPPPEITPKAYKQSIFNFLGPELIGAKDRAVYIPTHLPSLPSKHTFKETPVETQRITDPRKVRELATEEGRLGEEALRRLVAAAKRETDSRANLKPARRGKEETMDSMWEKTVTAVMKGGLKKSKKSKKLLPTGIDVEVDGSGTRPRARSAAIEEEIDIPMGESSTNVGESSKTVLIKVDSGPVVNAERRFWRKTKQAGAQKPQREKVVVEAQDAMMEDS